MASLGAGFGKDEADEALLESLGAGLRLLWLCLFAGGGGCDGFSQSMNWLGFGDGG